MINFEDLNQKLVEADYAVRGKLVLRAQELEKQGQKIIYCNIGNPHVFNQKPLTYVREVLSLLEFPQLIPRATKLVLYHNDSIEKAKEILTYIPEGVGAYSISAGLEFVRKAIANFINLRDNIPAQYEQIILTDGAGKAAQTVITALIASPNHGIMVPIPQYPLYSASLTLFGGKTIGYYLDEANNWQLNEESLEASINQARQAGIIPVAITVINPGNPTGAVLSYENIQMVVRFAQKYNLAILADEVYQENIYSLEHEFHSFAKVIHEMNINDVSLFSLHSISKGFFGECGHRGGYFEVRNVPKSVLEQLAKLQSINLCSNIIGQIVVYLMVNPPKPGDASYNLFVQERDNILDDLKEKAYILGSELNKIPGIKVNIPDGAMYTFVRFELPQYLMVNESKRNTTIDEKYTLALLESTGICVVPGSGFGQLPGTLHFRTTFLPPRKQILELVAKFKQFHLNYIKN